MAGDQEKTCFIAMPITTHEDEATLYNDDEHWRHVIDALLVPAVEAAGFRAVRPETQGAHMIHAQIIRQLVEADMVLCDLSRSNPNVFFELGVRTSLNKPIALVIDEHSKIPFDTSGINTLKYNSELRGWLVEEQRLQLSEHLVKCEQSCDGDNPLWKHFGLTLTADAPRSNESPEGAKLDLLSERMDSMAMALSSLAMSRSEPVRQVNSAKNRRTVDQIMKLKEEGRVLPDSEEFVFAAVREGLVDPEEIRATGPRQVEIRVSEDAWVPRREHMLRNLANHIGVFVDVIGMNGRPGRPAHIASIQPDVAFD